MRVAQPSASRPLAATGIAGLDDILRGGLTADRLFLVEGVPGSGKTTLALQFLMEGVRLGEPVLYVTLSETGDELDAVAESHGWSLEGMHVHELRLPQDALDSGEHYTMFHPSEIELSEATQSVMEEVERIRPRRLVFDSLSEMRLLSESPLRYRRQILALKRYFAGRNCTVLLLDDLAAGNNRDLQVQSMAHGVLRLEQSSPEYGIQRRRLCIVKFRGLSFRGGYHDYEIRRGGLEVFPRLVAAEHRSEVRRRTLRSGLPELDQLLGGGIECGSSMLLAGPPGTGKSTLATQFACTAAADGMRCALFVFDESLQTLLSRSAGVGLALSEHMREGRIAVTPVDPAELSPGEFAQRIRSAVEEDGVGVVVIDSLNGYLNSMPEERFLTTQLHELLTYLGQRNVATLLVASQQGLIGSSMRTPVDASYLADGIILLRYFEAAGEVRQAISVIKKRSGTHERSIREFRMVPAAVEVGEPLHQFHGVLSGIPTWTGSQSELMGEA